MKYAIATILFLFSATASADRGPKVSKPDCTEVLLCSGDAPGCRPCIGRRPPPNCSGEGPNCEPAPPNCSGCVLVPEGSPWLSTLVDGGCDLVREVDGEVLVQCEVDPDMGPPPPGLQCPVRHAGVWYSSCSVSLPPACSGEGTQCVPHVPPLPPSCTGPDGYGDCAPPPSPEAWWLELAFGDGCSLVSSGSGPLFVECP